MINQYTIGGHYIEVVGTELCTQLNKMDSFNHFLCPTSIEKDITCYFIETHDKDIPTYKSTIYELEDEGIKFHFGTTKSGYRLHLILNEKHTLNLWTNNNSNQVYLSGAMIPRLIRFALWNGYGIKTINTHTALIHTSCIVYQHRAVLFLGESGTGKSTHTQLWKKHIDGSHLLNDDSPIVRIEGNKIWVYGSPWSGKTPCYRNERFELKACVRLSQASSNTMRKLSIVEGYAAIHPSCPPSFAYHEPLYNDISKIIEGIVTKTACYHLSCLPNKEAAELSQQTLFNL